MSGETKEKFDVFRLPAPIDGMNLIATDDDLKATEARVLSNYLIYDSGIKQACGDPAVAATYSSASNIGMQFPYIDANQVQQELYSHSTKIWRLSTALASTDVTGAAVITSPTWFPCYFNKTIFLFNGVDTPLTHDLGAASNVAAWTGTGPTLTTLIQGCGFKHRLYIVQKDSTKFWYGSTDAIAGAFTAYDLGTVFERPGNLLCAFSWTLNQGLTNTDLIVFLSTTGEVLVYDGDDPGTADSWVLIARGSCPTPVGRQPFVKLSADTGVVTSRGIIPMQSIIVGTPASKPYYSLSRNIKDTVATTIRPVVDSDSPFLFAVGSDGADSIYVLNYERAAWSRLRFTEMPLGGGITSMAIFNGWLMLGTDGNGTAPKLYKVDLSSTASTTLSYIWTTARQEYGFKGEKNVKFIRIQAENTVQTTVRMDVRMIPDYGGAGAYDSKTVDIVSTAGQVEVELSPPGTGRRLRTNFSRVGVSGEKHEIHGGDIFYTKGGLY